VADTLWRHKHKNSDVTIPSPEYGKLLDLMEVGNLLPNEVYHETRVGY
jgi:hypothetical protein